MTITNYITVKNNEAVATKNIPEHNYQYFVNIVLGLMQNSPSRHCITYFGYPFAGKIKLICCIADDDLHVIFLIATSIEPNKTYPSLTEEIHAFEKFEREIHENFGINYSNHPWLKPLRYAFNRANQHQTIENYPFFKADSEELHEVGVGPIHAGIIEPGHFRFICNGEQIKHLEIQLGYQHRGIESLFLKKKKILELASLAETIAGDTVVAHTTAFSNLWESLCNIPEDNSLNFARTMALELERIAIHTGDLSAICTDIAYQMGSSVYGRLRTPIVNFFQEWCGNRLAKGLIRVGKINFPFSQHLANRLTEVLNAYEPDFDEITNKFFKLPSALSRMEKTGVVTYDQVLEIGTVGMAARMSGLNRDIRLSHPHNLYSQINHFPIIKHHGDVYSRAQIRKSEIKQSILYIRKWIKNIPEFSKPDNRKFDTKPDTLVVSLIEGWRGEICHCAITDHTGNLLIYKIKDPSHHNWMALALAVRNNEISDFPICNKSFNLSYCGHDL